VLQIHAVHLRRPGSFCHGPDNGDGELGSIYNLDLCRVMPGSSFSVYDQTKGLVIGVATTCSGNAISGFVGGWNNQLQSAQVATGSSGDVIVFAPSITWTGPTFYLNWLCAKSYTSPELKTITTAMYKVVINNGGSAPSQLHMANSLGRVNTGADSRGIIGARISAAPTRFRSARHAMSVDRR
jgi:hypothetical protein